MVVIGSDSRTFAPNRVPTHYEAFEQLLCQPVSGRFGYARHGRSRFPIQRKRFRSRQLARQVAPINTAVPKVKAAMLVASPD